MDRRGMDMDKIARTGWARKRGWMNKQFRKRYFILRSDRTLSYYKDGSVTDRPSGVVVLDNQVKFYLGRECDKQINWPADAVERFRFQIATAKRTFYICCESQEAAAGWIRALKQVVGQMPRDMHPSDASQLQKLEYVRKSQVFTHEDLSRRVQQLARQATNALCFDCNSTKEVTWTSCNLGVFLCFNCQGTHRELGGISHVRSILIDKWTICQVRAMEGIGNLRAQPAWEGKLASHPSYASGSAEQEQFIRDKYLHKKWLDESALTADMRELMKDVEDELSNDRKDPQASNVHESSGDDLDSDGEDGDLTPPEED
eukprot:m.61989 g.61989  ORF g.61989 m.61989 type:complete len:316 (-) comp13764_c0_seq1:246-1193(-)